jgi:hypothetical protein
MFARFWPSCFPVTLWKANRAVFRTRQDPGSSHPNQCAVSTKNGRKFESDHKSPVKLILLTAACNYFEQMGTAQGKKVALTANSSLSFTK